MSGLSKAEYLKKYMSDSTESKPKKRRKKGQNSVPTKKVIKSRIVDDDVDLIDVAPKDTTDIYADDEKPTVADVIDERPEHIQQLETYRNEKWKTLNKRKGENVQNSPERRTRYDSDSDSSKDNNSLPKRQARHDSDSDQSPIQDDSDQSPVRKRVHNSSDSDLSPARQNSDKVKSREDSDSDQSPPRSRKRKTNSDSDLSPKRQRNSDSDLSPVRKSSNSKSDVKATKTSTGATAGLSSAKEMREEMDKLRKKERKAFETMDTSKTGRGAATVIRDKSGKIVDMHEEMKKEREKKQKQEKYSKWSKGLKQQELQQASVEDMMHEMSKPLARYEDDEDLDAALKDQDRDGDPMLAFLKSKKKTKKGGTLPRYSGPPPPLNRFGIHPGYRWDGVDRYNGFEKKFFEQMNARKAKSEAAFKWSTEDM